VAEALNRLAGTRGRGQIPLAKTMHTLTYQGPACLKANELFTAVLHVSTGRELTPRARVVVAVRHVCDLGQPQMTEPTAENYVTVGGHGSGVRWGLSEQSDWSRYPWNRGIDLRLEAGIVPQGTTLTIHMGDPAGGCPGYRCQSFAERRCRLRLGIDPDGSGDWEVAPETDLPGFQVRGARATRLCVRVPNGTGIDSDVVVCVRAEDAYGNIAGEPAGEVALLDDDSRPLGRVTLEPDQPSVTRLPRPADGTWHHVTAASDNGDLFARSNPFGPSPLSGSRLYWGDIHVMSDLSCGVGSPDELYERARHTAGLDFAAVTTSDMQLTPQRWNEVKEAARRRNDPGRFVTFLAYEWSGPHERGGDHNIYFTGDDGPLIPSRPGCGLPAWDEAVPTIGRTRTLAETIDELAGVKAMLVPHCGGRQCNLDFHEPSLMPFMEIHSCHRNFEHVACEAIRRGLRLGFVGGSDDHRGAPGYSTPTARDPHFSAAGGLLAVYAQELTRESLWQAFFDRRVYATSGARMVLDFRIDDTPMGGVVRMRPDQEAHLRFWTRLDGLLDHVDLVGGTETIERFTGQASRVDEFAFEHCQRIRPGATPYFVRVVQVDGATAWSSPIWVEAG